jgi:transcriptional regulator with XRE-family HTH domain
VEEVRPVSRPRRPPELPREASSATASWARALAEVMRGWRALHRQTAQQLADRGDLDVRQVQRLERGNGNPTLESLLRAAAAMGLSPAQLFEAIERAIGTEATSSPAPLAPERRDHRPLPPPRRLRSDPAMDRIAAVLRQRRRALALSQHDLAARAGLSRSKVQSIESTRHAATLDTLDALARALECDVADLLQRSSSKR